MDERLAYCIIDDKIVKRFVEEKSSKQSPIKYLTVKMLDGTFCRPFFILSENAFKTLDGAKVELSKRLQQEAAGLQRRIKEIESLIDENIKDE